MGLFACCFLAQSLLDAAASSIFLFFFCENADFSGGESEMASLSSPESRIKAAAQPGIKNQARCAGRNQESRITGGGQFLENHDSAAQCQWWAVVQVRHPAARVAASASRSCAATGALSAASSMGTLAAR